MAVSIIIHHSLMTGDSHNHSTFGHNLQPTVSGDAEIDIKVVVRVGELASSQVHIIRTHSSTRCGSRTRYIGNVVAAVVGYSGKACHTLCLTVEGHHPGITRNGHIHAQRVDGQGIGCKYHMVVALFGSTRGRNDVCTGILARFTAQRVANHTGRLTVLYTGHRSGQSRILVAIHLGLGIGGNNNIGFNHLQCTTHLHQIVITGHILGSAHHSHTAYLIRQGTNIGNAAVHGSSHHIAICQSMTRSGIRFGNRIVLVTKYNRIAGIGVCQTIVGPCIRC